MSVLWRKFMAQPGMRESLAQDEEIERTGPSELEILQQRARETRKLLDKTDAGIKRLEAIDREMELTVAVNALAAQKAILERLQDGHIEPFPQRNWQLTIVPPTVPTTPSAFWSDPRPNPYRKPEALDFWEKYVGFKTVEPAPNSCSHPNKDPEIYRQVCHELGVPIEAVREHFQKDEQGRALTERPEIVRQALAARYVIEHGGRLVREEIPEESPESAAIVDRLLAELETDNRTWVIEHLGHMADTLAAPYSPRHRKASRWYRAWKALTRAFT